MSKISNIDGVRELALEALQNLRDGKIEVNEALAVGKMCDSVIHTVKAQLDYHRMVNQTPIIPFMQNAELTLPNNTIDVTPKQKTLDAPE